MQFASDLLKNLVTIGELAEFFRGQVHIIHKMDRGGEIS
jgi:hypothetical protein